MRRAHKIIWIVLWGLVVGSVFPRPTVAAESASFNLGVTIIDYTVVQLNSCDNHAWAARDWGADFNLTYGTFNGRRAVQAKVTNPDNAWALFQTDIYVQPDDWSSYGVVSVDIYNDSASAKGFELVLDDANNNELFRQTSSVSVNPGSWQTVTWNTASFPANVSQVNLVFTAASFQVGDKVYFSNLRLGTGGKTWDPFSAPSYRWEGSGDFVPWSTQGRNDGIANQVTYANSPGAVVLPWDSAQDVGVTFAKMQATNLSGFDYSGNTTITMQCFSTSTAIPIYIEFWDGTIHNTTPQNVGTANSWQLLTWTIPGAVDLKHLQAFSLMLDTSAASGSGKVYIDDIRFNP